jgi:ribonucleoside-diphosphate reductase alpha chain
MSERALGKERRGKTVKLELQGEGGTIDFYITANEYEDGTLAEIFVQMGGAGGTLQGLLDAWCVTFSMGIRQGLDWERLALVLASQRFEPNGMTNDARLREVRSIFDYVMRWLARSYGSVSLVSALDEMGRTL